MTMIMGITRPIMYILTYIMLNTPTSGASITTPATASITAITTTRCRVTI